MSNEPKMTQQAAYAEQEALCDAALTSTAADKSSDIAAAEDAVYRDGAATCCCNIFARRTKPCLQ